MPYLCELMCEIIKSIKFFLKYVFDPICCMRHSAHPIITLCLINRFTSSLKYFLQTQQEFLESFKVM